MLSSLAEVIAHAKTGKWKNADHDFVMSEATRDGYIDQTMYDADAAAQETVAVQLKQILSGQRPRDNGTTVGEH